MTVTSSPKFPAAAIRRLSVDAEVDPRTIRRELRTPGVVRGMTGDRIRRAIRAMTKAVQDEAKS